MKSSTYASLEKARMPDKSKHTIVNSVLDAKTGFWQVKLAEALSYLTPFNPLFGRYRWKRMPFGISSAPEGWQQKMTVL